MKAFVFRLEGALRWRTEQTDIQKSRLSAAAGRAAQANVTLESGKSEARNAAAAVKQSPDGAALSTYADFAARSKIRIRELEKQARDAQSALTTERAALVEANRAVRLLEKFRHTEFDRWRHTLDREVETFAAEAFLQRLKPGKQTGA